MEVFIISFLFRKIQDPEEFHDILEILSRDSLRSKGILVKRTSKILFKIKKELIKMKNDNMFNIDIIKPKDKLNKRIYFINLNDNNDNCIFLYFDINNNNNNNNNLLEMQLKMKEEDYIASEDNKHKYKVIDLLIKLTLKMIKKSEEFSHIKEIKISDYSTIKCCKDGFYYKQLDLSCIRTITKGIPFYAKYGFLPECRYEYNCFRHNKRNYKLNKMITNEQLFNILEETKKYLKKNNFYNNFFIKFIENNEIINPKELLINLIKNIYLINEVNEKKEIYYVICYIYNEIYELLGYKRYNNNKWILKIRN